MDEAWSDFGWFCVVSLSVTFGEPLRSVWVYQTNSDPQALGPRRRLWLWDTHILSWSSIYRAAFLILLKSGSCPWVCYSVQCAGGGNNNNNNHHHHHHEWQLTMGCQRSLAPCISMKATQNLQCGLYWKRKTVYSISYVDWDWQHFTM